MKKYSPEEISRLAQEWIEWFDKLDRKATKEEMAEGYMRGAICKEYFEGYIKTYHTRPLSPLPGGQHGRREKREH